MNITNKIRLVIFNALWNIVHFYEKTKQFFITPPRPPTPAAWYEVLDGAAPARKYSHLSFYEQKAIFIPAATTVSTGVFLHCDNILFFCPPAAAAAAPTEEYIISASKHNADIIFTQIVPSISPKPMSIVCALSEFQESAPVFRRPEKDDLCYVEYCHPEMGGTIYFRGIEQYNFVGNRLFRRPFLEKLLRESGEEYVLDDKYTIHIMKNDMETVTLSAGEYIEIGDSGFRVIRAAAAEAAAAADE